MTFVLNQIKCFFLYRKTPIWLLIRRQGFYKRHCTRKWVGLRMKRLENSLTEKRLKHYFPEWKKTWRSVAQIPFPHNIAVKLVWSCWHMICHLFVDSTNIGLFPRKGYSGRRQRSIENITKWWCQFGGTFRSILLLIPSGPVALPGSRESKTYVTSMS